MLFDDRSIFHEVTDITRLIEWDSRGQGGDSLHTTNEYTNIIVRP